MSWSLLFYFLNLLTTYQLRSYPMLTCHFISTVEESGYLEAKSNYSHTTTDTSILYSTVTVIAAAVSLLLPEPFCITEGVFSESRQNWRPTSFHYRLIFPMACVTAFALSSSYNIQNLIRKGIV